METQICDCPNKDTNKPKMTVESENSFWMKVNEIYTGDRKDLLEKKARLSVYYSLPGKTGHAALAFSEDNKWAFDLGLCFSEDRKEMLPHTKVLGRISEVKYHRLRGIYLKTTPKNLYQKGVTLMKRFGCYNYGCNNCQDFIFQFLTSVGIKSPILPFSERGKTAAKIVTAPLWVLGTGVLCQALGVVGMVTAPIWYPISRLKGASAEDANLMLGGCAVSAVAGVIAGPAIAGMVMFTDDELATNAERAKKDGIEVEKEHAD